MHERIGVWHFAKTDPITPITGATIRNALDATSRSTEAMIVREAFQNSCDAAIGEPPVRIVVRKRALVGKAKRHFAETLRLNELAPDDIRKRAGNSKILPYSTNGD